MNNERHTKEKIRAFFQEFAFLGQLTAMDDVGRVRVSRIEPELMNLTPYCRAWGVLRYSIRFLDKDGKVLATVGGGYESDFWSLFDFIWGPQVRIKNPRESISDAVRRIGNDAKRVAYILVEERSEGTLITLYKLPKDWKTIPDWIAHLIDGHQKAFQTEAAAIDTEGDHTPGGLAEV